MGVHFFIAAFSQAPLSPAKIRFNKFMTGYLEPYSSQNWMLFAPEPVQDDEGIVARAKCTDGTVTGYHDVTGPSIDRVQQSRSSSSRMSRLVSNGIQQYNNTDDLMARLRQRDQEKKDSDTEDEKAKGGEEKPDIQLAPHEQHQRDEGEKFLSRVALTQMPVSAHVAPHR